MAHALIDTLSLTGMNQFNFVLNNKNRTLNLVMSNVDHIRTSVAEDVDPLVVIDKQHPDLMITVDMKPLKYLEGRNNSKLTFFRADYVQLDRLAQDIDWVQELESLGMVEAIVYSLKST